MPDIACAVGRYGRDHRPALITKAYKPVILHIVSVLSSVFGGLGAGGPRPRPADPRSFAVDHPSFFSARSCSVGWAESMIEASVSADG